MEVISIDRDNGARIFFSGIRLVSTDCDTYTGGDDFTDLPFWHVLELFAVSDGTFVASVELRNKQTGKVYRRASEGLTARQVIDLVESIDACENVPSSLTDVPGQRERMQQRFARRRLRFLREAIELDDRLRAASDAV